MKPGDLVLSSCKIFLEGAPYWIGDSEQPGSKPPSGFLRKNEVGLVIKKKENYFWGHKLFVLCPTGKIGWIYEDDLKRVDHD